MILQRYKATKKEGKRGTTFEATLPADAIVRSFINQGTLGIFCYAVTAGGPLQTKPSVFIGAKPGDDTLNLTFVCVLKLPGGYYHVHGPKETA